MNFNTKILIVEDEILIADFIEDFLLKKGFTNIKMSHKQQDAIDAFQSFEPEIILLDINLNGVNAGIELAQLANKNASIIFVTGQNDDALMNKALGTNPKSYLTKPIKEDDLLAAIKLVIFKKQANSISIKIGYDFVKLHYDEILFIKSDFNYLDIQTTTRKYTIRQSLDRFIEQVKDSNLRRVHRSYIINLSKITLKTSKTVFIDSYEIPTSKKYKFEL